MVAQSRRKHSDRVVYSHILSVKPAAEQTAQALVKALSGAELKAAVSGSMALSPNSEVNVAAGQTVALKEGAIVKLDPNSAIRVVGDLKYDLPQPSKRQLQEDTTSSGHGLPFTSYTVFKSTDYGAGQVETGWSFDLSDPMRPKRQFCSYRQTISKGKVIKYTIAKVARSRLDRLRFVTQDPTATSVVSLECG